MNKENEIKNEFTPLELLKIMGFELSISNSAYNLEISNKASVTISLSQAKKIKNYKDVAIAILDEGFYLGQLCKAADIKNEYLKTETLLEYNTKKEREYEQRKA